MSTPTEQPAHPAQPVRRPWLLAGLAAAFVAIVVVIIMVTSSGKSDDGSGTARTKCQDSVKARLKSPASAQFSQASTTHDAGQTADFYTVTGSVDSQNGFGAMLRSTYACKLVAERDGSWKLTDLTFSGR